MGWLLARAWTAPLGWNSLRTRVRGRFTPASSLKSIGIHEGQPGSAWTAFAGPMYPLPRDTGGVGQEHCRPSGWGLDARGLNGA